MTESTSTNVPTVSTPDSPPPAVPVAGPRLRAAYEQITEELKALREADLVPLNIDILAAASKSLGALPSIRSQRATIVEEVPKFDIARFDRLETYTLAACYAHGLFMSASQPPEALDAVIAEGTVVRQRMLGDANALAGRNLIDGERLSQLKGAVGYRNLASDLILLSTMMRERFAAIAGKTAITMDEIDQAETLADSILRIVGLREQGPQVVADSADTRQRAYTLFFKAYDDARRAISYLRWQHEDVEQIVPSLYAGRFTRHKGDSGEAGASSPPAVPAPTGPTAPVTNPVPIATPHAVGLPTSEPFTHS